MRYIATNRTTPETRANTVGILFVMLIIGHIIGGSLGAGVADSHGDP